MKKILILFFSVLALAFTLTACDNLNPPQPDSSTVYGSLDYLAVEENGQVIGYEVSGIGTYSSNEVRIPQKHNDKPVIGIADSAFAGIDRLLNVDMGPSVTYIGNNAFSGCVSLQWIGLSKNITKIGGNCFYGCNALTYNYDQVGGGSYLGNDANPYMVFMNCSKMDELILHEDTKIIYSSAFAHSDLKSINLPKNLAVFSGMDFLDCKNLTSITVDEDNQTYFATQNAIIRRADNALMLALDSVDLSALTVEAICEYAFANWNKTDVITINNYVTIIEDNAFAYGKFSGINLPATIQSIGVRIFYSCSNLVMIGDFVSENYYCQNNCIVDTKGKAVLAGCRTSVIPTEKVTSIGKMAFFYCVGLKEITIPENIVKIDDMAFYWCDQLETVSLPESMRVIGENAFTLCKSLKNVIINEGVYMIKVGAFSSCSSLETVSLPSTISYIEENAFRSCPKLKTVYYAGSLEDFLNISIGDNNESLTTADVICKN